MAAGHSSVVQTDTRTRLLRTALAVFAHRDFEAVSVREIVDQAGANIAAISYHFGGKQALYLATAEFLADAMQDQLGPTLARIGAEVEGADPSAARRMLEEIIQQLVHSLTMDRLGEDAAGFILREQHQPTAAFDILYERLMKPIQETYQMLVSRMLGEPESNRRRQVLITHALMGQILAFRSARTTVLRRLDQADFSEQDAREIADVVSCLTLNALQAHHTRKNQS
jgi:TetR/AcrR family transcriptional regulator, regulator of cefoperazone and chloramphenicol sensitivity